jgi:hypothetical protein
MHGKQQPTHLENKYTPLEYKFTTRRTDVESILHIQCNGRKNSLMKDKEHQSFTDAFHQLNMTRKDGDATQCS